MIKVNFKETTECLYRGRVYRFVMANFILCKSVSKISFTDDPILPSIVNDHLYIPNGSQYIKSIEHVKPTDL